MKSPFSYVMAGCVLLLAVVALCGHWPDTGLRSYRHSIERLNAHMPVRLDGETEVESVRLVPESREIRYTYVVLHHDANEFDQQLFAQGAATEHRHSLCEQNRNGLQSAIEEGLRMRHTYLGADGRFIASVVVDPRHCLVKAERSP